MLLLRLFSEHSSDFGDESLAVFGKALDKSFGRGGLRVVSRPPTDQLQQDGQQVYTLVGKCVDDLSRILRVGPSGDDPARFERLQSLGENIGGDFLVGRQEVAEISLMRENQVANNKQRPFIAEYVESKADRAKRAARRCKLGH